MERENFYLLLSLSVDPPEEEQERIEGAIKRMQAQWSRYRNHPTKAIQAQKYIGLIPLIRKVMRDPDLRRNEAREAQKILRRKEREQFAEIDRHLDIRMSKGYITEEEIFKLAQFHSIAENKIRARIKRKKKKKFADIDEHLSIRIAKGYITEEEISKLAKLHAVDKKEIRKRVKCPVRRESTGKAEHSMRLDPAVVKVINANLKIVGKLSLYDFLEMAPISSLPSLQKRVREIEQEALSIGKKDAIVTAKGVLAGHCTTIFNTEENRNAYDVSRARSRLEKLNADIDVAGMDGKICVEYFDILVNTALDFGMDREEAVEYIEEYCRNKNWVIESRKYNFRKLVAVVLGVVFILTSATGVAVWALNSKGLKEEYQKALLKAGNQETLEEKEKIFQRFVSSHAESSYALEAEKKIGEIRDLIEERDFRIIDHQAVELCKTNHLEKAVENYRQHLSRYPAGKLANEIKAKIGKISSAIDDRNFEALVSVAPLDTDKRMNAYLEYLAANPKTRHRDAVRKMIADMREEYYFYVTKTIRLFEKREEWDQCIQQCDRYIEIYKEDSRSQELKELRASFQEKLQEKRIYDKLRSEAESKRDDYQAAKQVYLQFLKVCPNSSLSERIKQELARLHAQAHLARIEKEGRKIKALLPESKGRFVEEGEGMIGDKKTGLMWCMLDSRLDLGECLDYESAVAYVNDLKTGGYNDWRLPTLRELAGIYKRKPFFPSLGTAWYWTSATYSRYADGWSKVVDTLTSEKSTGWEGVQRESWRCGAVRAVRP